MALLPRCSRFCTALTTFVVRHSTEEGFSTRAKKCFMVPARCSKKLGSSKNIKPCSSVIPVQQEHAEFSPHQFLGGHLEGRDTAGADGNPHRSQSISVSYSTHEKSETCPAFHQLTGICSNYFSVCMILRRNKPDDSVEPEVSAENYARAGFYLFPAYL